jgi:NADH:ubiquinone oxidoreductase subunit 3 (subunit A)
VRKGVRLGFSHNLIEIYSTLLIVGLSSLSLPVLLLVASKFVKKYTAIPNRDRRRSPLTGKRRDPSYLMEAPRVNFRITSALCLSIGFISMIFLIIPGVKKTNHSSQVVVMITLLLFLLLAFVYSVRKGDLHWWRSYRAPLNKRK